MKIRTYEISKSKLGKKLGQIFTGQRDKNYKYLNEAYLDGQIPILIETNIRHDLWDKVCNDTLTQAERFELALQGII